jgi:predicted PolB exonuclease-like 3'-5' exonuclease
MTDWAIIWDLETVLDAEAAARLLDMEGADEEAVREKHGEAFPKLPLHKIVCIGALIAKCESDRIWRVESLGAPHIGERSEAELITAFDKRILETRAQLVSFNGTSFDLPVLRYRAMINRVAAPGLATRNYFYRYSEDNLDLCDSLSAFESKGKLKLDDLCRILGLPGKPEGVDGSKVGDMVMRASVAAGGGSSSRSAASSPALSALKPSLRIAPIADFDRLAGKIGIPISRTA